MEPVAGDPLFILANRIEAVFWVVCAAGLLIAAFRRKSENESLPPGKRALGPGADVLISAVTLVLFGVSDLVETVTGAWWRPWWLLLWKGVCVAILAALTYRHYRKSSNKRERPAENNSRGPR